MNWQRTKIQGLCDITSSKRIYASDYVSGGVPFYRGKEIIEKHRGKLDVSVELFILQEKYLEIKNKFGTPEPGDLLLTSVGTLGVPYVVKQGEVFYFKDGNLTWFRNFRGLDSQFLEYWLQSPDGKAELRKCTIGSSQPAYTIVLLKNMEIQLPPLPTQRKIADILSAYDDLIENNTRRIQILEEMAQTIYREWFVHFRFPGHEDVEMVETEVGLVPNGWEIKSLGDLVETQYGYTESATDLPVGPKFLRGMDINKSSHIEWDRVPYCRIGQDLLPRYKTKVGDVLVIRMADPGKTGIIEQEIEAVFASYLIRLQIKSAEISPYYLFYFLNSDRYQNYISGASTGTTRKSASAGVVIGIDIAVAPSRLRQHFEENVKLLRTMLNNLVVQNTNLRQTRDLLLPKLVSGEIDAGGLQIETKKYG